MSEKELSKVDQSDLDAVCKVTKDKLSPNWLKNSMYDIDIYEENVVTLHNSGYIIKWNLENRSIIKRYRIDKYHDITKFALSIYGDYVAFSNFHDIYIMGLENGDIQVLKDTLPSYESISSMIFFDNNDLLVSGACGTIIVFDINRMRVKKQIQGNTFMQFGLTHYCSISPNQHYVLTGGENFIRIYDLLSETSAEYKIEKSIKKCYFTENHNILICCYDFDSNNQKYICYINWIYEFPGWSDWDNSAMPTVYSFLKSHQNPSEKDIYDLMLTLQSKGLGWIRKEGVKRKILKMRK